MNRMSYLHSGCYTLPKKTFKELKESKNEWIIQLKWNQKNLYKNCEKILEKQENIWKNKTYNEWRNEKKQEK